MIEGAKVSARWPVERSWTRRRLLGSTLLALCFLFIAGLLLVSLRARVYVYDEGLAVLGGARLLNGQIPYRDFWTIYPPGQSYALAAVFQLFGTSLLVARAYDTVVRLALVIAVYLVGRRIAALPVALVAGVLSALWLGTVEFHSYGLFPALVWALLATWATLVVAGSDQRKWLVLAGILVGLTALWRIDVAAYLGIALVVSLFLSAFLTSGNVGLDKPFARAVGRAAILVGVALVASAPVYVYLALVGGIEPMWQQLIVFPATVLGRVRRLSYPELLPNVALFLAEPVECVRWARFLYPPLVYAVSLAYLAWRLAQARHAGREGLLRLVGGTTVTVLGMCLFAQALSRYDWIHVLPSTICASLVTGWLVCQIPRASWRRWPVAVTLVALLAAILITCIVPSVHDLESILKYASPLQCHSSLDRASCAVVQSDQERAVSFVRARTGEGEPIFVGNARHDQILINDAAFYFLAARPSATRYHELHPGVATTLSVQEEIVSEIQAANVAWVVTVEWPPSTEPNESAVSSGVVYLDEFIRAEYQPSAEFGQYTVWRRR